MTSRPVLLAAAIVLSAAAFASADPITFKTTDDAASPFRVSTHVKATGRPILSAGGGKTAPHVMTANAEFTFTERCTRRVVGLRTS